MGYEVKCSNCEVELEVIVKDYLLEEDEPQMIYCPNCGKATLE